MRVALCFPGQGSQTAGMAEGLLDLPLARELLEEAEACGVELEAALGGGDETLRPTAVAQPALLLVEVVLAGEIPSGLDIVGVAGHSVGEYAAAVAARSLTPRQAMRLVIRRSEAMAASSEGMMAAFLGLDEEAVRSICEEASAATGEHVVVANINGPAQIVVSGTLHAVTKATQLATDRGLRREVPLNVSGAFHSPLMAPASEEFARSLDEAAIAQPIMPVVCNVDGEAVTDADDLRDHLRRQLTSPVRWTSCVRRLVETLEAQTLVEVGPGEVLSGLARRIVPDIPAHAVATAEAARHLSATLGV